MEFADHNRWSEHHCQREAEGFRACSLQLRASMPTEIVAPDLENPRNGRHTPVNGPDDSRLFCG